MNLTEQVSQALGVTLEEADEVIENEAGYCSELLETGDLDYEAVVQAMADMGIEPDNMDEFLLRI